MYYKYLRIFNHNIWQHSWAILDGNCKNIIVEKYKYFFKIYIELHNKLTTTAHTTDHYTFCSFSKFGRFPERFLLEIESLNLDIITMYFFCLEMVVLEMVFLEMFLLEMVVLEMVFLEMVFLEMVHSRNSPF